MKYEIPAYKNLRESSISINKNVVVIGENGAGKSNLLEKLEDILNPNQYYEEMVDRGITLKEEKYINNEVIRIRSNRMFRNFLENDSYVSLELSLDELKSFETIICEKYDLYYSSYDFEENSNNMEIYYEEYVKVIINMYYKLKKYNSNMKTIESIVEEVFETTIENNIDINKLSDGMKSVVFIVAYLEVFEHEAKSCIPRDEISEQDFKEYEGDVNRICIIDEMDLNIHARTVKLLYKYLNENYLNWKFIVSTHSAALINELNNSTNTYLVKNGIIEKVDNFYAKSLNDVYEKLFNVDIYNEYIKEIYMKLKLNLIKAYNDELTTSEIEELALDINEIDIRVFEENAILNKYYEKLKEYIC